MSKKRDRGTFSAWAAVTRVVGIYTGRGGKGGEGGAKMVLTRELRVRRKLTLREKEIYTKGAV